MTFLYMDLDIKIISKKFHNIFHMGGKRQYEETDDWGLGLSEWT